MRDVVTVALSKGKLLKPTLALFQKAGYLGADLLSPSFNDRRMVLDAPESGASFLVIRPTDVPTYVEYGAADVGVAGKDSLLEQQLDVYEPLDLRIGWCRISVAAVDESNLRTRLSSKLRVATKYPNITERYFNERGIPVEIIKLYGSIELAPMVGLSDRVVDLVSSGRTLNAHHLRETDIIAESTARLIVNRASLKMKHQMITTMINRLRKSRPGVVARSEGT